MVCCERRFGHKETSVGSLRPRFLTVRVSNLILMAGTLAMMPEQIDPIIAPSYRMFKDVNEEAIIAESLETYKVTLYTKRVKKTKNTHA